MRAMLAGSSLVRDLGRRHDPYSLRCLPQVHGAVRAALGYARAAVDVEIRSVYLGVTGGHLRGFNNRGVHPVVSADREISEVDVQDVIKFYEAEAKSG